MSKLNPSISIIVCHHVGDLIYPFVESVKKYCATPYEIIVISSDAELFTIEGCRIYFSTELPAEKRNIGVSLSRSPYIAFFDDDVEITAGCVEQMFRLLLKSDVGMVFGKLHKYGTKRFDEAGSYLTKTGFLWSRAGQNIHDTGQYDDEIEILAGKSASCMIKKTIFNKIGGFDKDFGILGEETDLAWRVWLFGCKVMYCPSSLAYHKFNTSLKPVNKHYTSERVQFNGCRNYITLLIKNLETNNLIIPLLLQFFIWGSAGFSMIMTGKFNQGWNILRGLSYIVTNRKNVMNKRRKVQWLRVKSDAILLPIILKRPPRGYYTQRFFKYITSAIHG